MKTPTSSIASQCIAIIDDAHKLRREVGTHKNDATRRSARSLPNAPNGTCRLSAHLTSAQASIDFYYDVVSPYSYIAFELVLRLAADHKGSLKLNLKPFLLGGPSCNLHLSLNLLQLS